MNAPEDIVDDGLEEPPWWGDGGYDGSVIDPGSGFDGSGIE